MTTIAIPKETKKGEARVAITPALVKKFTALGLSVKLESGAGNEIYAEDSFYKDVAIVNEASELYASDIVIKVNPPTLQEVEKMKENAILISFLYANSNPETVELLRVKKITSFAMEMIPRISRAQDMDALSSQATISGYKSVLIAANEAKFFFPMLTTAAGSIRPAKVLIIGAGVAGLQAIATAKRLGAIVSAYDVRKETKEQIESLGAKFVNTGVVAESSGGYARELTNEEIATQREMLKKHISESDVIITTAGVPGKPAPKIIWKDMIETMKPGSVIVDIMAEMGGNCELVESGKTVVHNNVKIVGVENAASSLSINASEMYSRNIINLLNLMVKEGGVISIDWTDEIIAGTAVTHNGEIVV